MLAACRRAVKVELSAASMSANCPVEEWLKVVMMWQCMPALIGNRWRVY